MFQTIAWDDADAVILYKKFHLFCNVPSTLKKLMHAYITLSMQNSPEKINLRKLHSFVVFCANLSHTPTIHIEGKKSRNCSPVVQKYIIEFSELHS